MLVEFVSFLCIVYLLTPVVERVINHYHSSIYIIFLICTFFFCIDKQLWALFQFIQWFAGDLILNSSVYISLYVELAYFIFVFTPYIIPWYENVAYLNLYHKRHQSSTSLAKTPFLKRVCNLTNILVISLKLEDMSIDFTFPYDHFYQRFVQDRHPQ